MLITTQAENVAIECAISWKCSFDRFNASVDTNLRRGIYFLQTENDLSACMTRVSFLGNYDGILQKVHVSNYAKLLRKQKLWLLSVLLPGNVHLIDVMRQWTLI